MKKNFLLGFAVLGLAVASAKTYTVNLYQAAKLGSMDLQPGAYSVEVKDNKAIVRNGKIHGEADVKVETVEKKFNSTTVRFANDKGAMQIQEIRLGGTKEKLVFNE